MRLLIHNNELSGRGDSTLTLTTAKMLREYYKVDVFIAVKESALNKPNRLKAIEKMGFEVFVYSAELYLQQFTRINQITHTLWVHDGKYTSQWLPETKQLVYAVFNNFEPYGDRYGYISEWLHHEAIKTRNTRDSSILDKLYTQGNSPYKVNLNMETGFVPLAVEASEGDGSNFRKQNDIPLDSFLIGRIGGYTEFDDFLLQQEISRLVNYSDLFFVFVNTRPFLLHPRIKYLDFIADDQYKWDFYAACNFLLNGRLMGESFGFSIIEPLSLGKPVIGPGKVRNRKMDAHHVQILEPLGLLYNYPGDAERIILKSIVDPLDSSVLKRSVIDFSTQVVSKKFNSFFLS